MDTWKTGDRHGYMEDRVDKKDKGYRGHRGYIPLLLSALGPI